MNVCACVYVCVCVRVRVCMCACVMYGVCIRIISVEVKSSASKESIAPSMGRYGT